MGTPKGTVPHNAGKGNGWVDPRGYRVVSKTVNGKRQQVREHRAIMESHLGRALESWEVVHHKDGNTLNNAIDNLEVMDAGDHIASHHRGSRKSYDTRRTMEAMANMREEIKRLRSSNAELLEALQALIAAGDMTATGARAAVAGAKAKARAAIAKATGEA